MQSPNQAIAQVDRSLRIVSCNTRFRDKFLHGREIGRDQSLPEVLPDKLLESLVRLCLESDDPIDDAEFSWPSSGPDRRHFLVSVVPSDQSAGTVIAGFYDVTEWKRLQKQVFEANRLKALGEAVAGIAHEINNPLAAIMGVSQLVLRRELDPSLRAELDTVLAQAKRAAEVVANLRVFGGVARPAHDRIDIVSLLRKVLDMKADWFRATGAALSTGIGQHAIMVNGDEHQLEQVFLNVITNAQQAVSEGDRAKALRIEVSAKGGMAHLEFADDGHGIASEDLPRVFDPFFTTREVGKGSGLGLSMCHRIVHQHGGTINIDSVAGKGATVTIELPAAPSLPPLEGGGVEAVEARTRSLRVLVVDDEPAIGGFLKRTLTDHGHTVDYASSGFEVVDRTDLDTYDLLLLDMKMPGIDGAELFDHLRHLPGDIASKVLFLTGDPANIATQEFIERTGSPVLGKPFTLEQLLDTVDRFTAGLGR